MREEFRGQLEQSGYIHQLLKPDRQKSAEARHLLKPVTKKRDLFASPEAWTGSGKGDVSLSAETLRMTAPARSEQDEPLPHYTPFSHLCAELSVQNEDWRGYNRIRCRVKPDCRGIRRPCVTLSLCNDGEVKIPDPHYREGFHVLNLDNGVWNECVWEFPDLPRDCVTSFAVSFESRGKEYRTGSDELRFELTGFMLEQVDSPDVSLGWQCADGTVCFSTTGYWTDSVKTAVASPELCADGFSLLDESSGKTVYKGVVTPLDNEKGSFGLLDFTDFRISGRYRIKTGNCVTESFAIDPHVTEEAVWKAINFIYAERCGFPVAGGHGFCHGDILAEHNGLRLSYAGGWHDAGDVSQQTVQTAEVTEALLGLAEKTCSDERLSRRLEEEARWGLDFVIRTAFGDGYRASSVGNTRWTNQLLGDSDDEPVRVHNRSFDNFIIASAEAYAGSFFKERDPELSYAAVSAAREDFKYALERYETAGMETCFVMEHTHNAGASLYYAAICDAAVKLFRASDDVYYAEAARRYAEKLLACQDNGEAGLPFEGFFYRCEKKTSLAHFNHQSREHLYITALDGMLGLDGSSRYAEAMRKYGGYIKAMSEYAAPYGMIPAGLHAFGEENDSETFALLHVMTNFNDEVENYKRQLANGIRLNDKFCVRHFPVWFSFRGNAAVQLSSAKAASLIGRRLNDGGLLSIARDQIYWLAGKNPFGQSMMYGEGSNYACQYAGLAGETVGEMPVGVQTRGNEDVPYWPMANWATYKEIWMSTIGHWLRVNIDLY